LLRELYSPSPKELMKEKNPNTMQSHTSSTNGTAKTSKNINGKPSFKNITPNRRWI